MYQVRFFCRNALNYVDSSVDLSQLCFPSISECDCADIFISRGQVIEILFERFLGSPVYFACALNFDRVDTTGETFSDRNCNCRSLRMFNKRIDWPWGVIMQSLSDVLRNMAWKEEPCGEVFYSGDMRKGSFEELYQQNLYHHSSVNITILHLACFPSALICFEDMCLCVHRRKWGGTIR